MRAVASGIVAGLRAIPGVTCTAPQGAFYVFPNISAHYNASMPDDTAVAKLNGFSNANTLQSFPAKPSARPAFCAFPTPRQWIASMKGYAASLAFSARRSERLPVI